MSDDKKIQKVENGKEEAEIELPEGVDQAAFDALAEIMEQQSAVEEEIDAYAHKKLAPVHDKRREVISKIPSFWPVVIESSGVLTEYMTLDDMQVFEKLKDLNVEWDDKEPKDFTITMEFDENDHLKTLKAAKKFTYVKNEDGTEKYTSEPVKLEWKKGKNLLLNKDDESIFNWFSYAGSGSGDYAAGHEIAALIADDIFPHAIKLFVDRSAFSDDEDIELEYDLDEDEEDNAEHEDAPPKKKLKADE